MAVVQTRISSPPRPAKRLPSPEAAKRALARLGQEFHRRGWSLATSSNYSLVVQRDPLRLLITASGKDKGRLSPADFVEVDETGATVSPGPERPSAETLLHTAIVRHTGAGAVLHTHSVWGTVLSDVFARPEGDGELPLDDLEMLKALAGVPSHEQAVAVPIFDNTQDMAALAKRLERRFAEGQGPSHGFLLRHHGLYTWGRDLAEARRHVEALEFLFEVTGRKRSLLGTGG